ncbi:MAG: SBBP repeat-containing protein [Rhodothermales bacterium]|nr:SBBP repeat-containing protein [Rhodothermales bacterium]
MPLSRGLSLITSATLVLSLGLGARSGRFEVAAPPAPSMALQFSTYLGGSDLDLGSAIALDADGAVYVAGQTFSSDFPTRNAAMGYQGGPIAGADGFVVKYSPGGDRLVYATYLGGSLGAEVITAMAVDGQGRVYVAGTTTAPDFPARNPIHTYRGGGQLLSDAFVARLSADGTEVEFATFLGGTGDETATALALGDDGSVYLTGTTTSGDFPTTAGVVQPEPARGDERARTDAFIVKLIPDGVAFSLGYATYLGGTWDEVPHALAVDAGGHAWVAGMTNSDDFPLQAPLQNTFGGPLREFEGDGFVTRLTPDGTALGFSTYLGGTQDDQATGLALGDDGGVYLTGSTMSNTLPTTPGAYQTERRGLRERFAARLMPEGAGWRIDYATRLGAAGTTLGRAGLAADRAGRVWIAGATSAEQFPTAGAEQAAYGGGETDAFVARLDASGTALGAATLLGGSAGEAVTALALGPDRVCVTGGTGSGDFPTRGARQAVFDGPAAVGLRLTSAFVACFATVNEAPVLTRIAVRPDSVGLIAREEAVFTAEGLDQFGQPAFALAPVWTATGGAIDSAGRYTAGDAAGVFAVTATDTASGLSASAVVNLFSGVPTEDPAGLPTAFALYGNYPNPFNPQTTIRFDVKEPARVVLTVYDVLGRRRATLLAKDHAPGRYAVRFDARGWPSGLYLYVIEMGSFRAAQRMLLVR